MTTDACGRDAVDRVAVERVGAAVRKRQRRRKTASVVTNELIIDGLTDFLLQRFPHGGASVLDLGAGTAPYAPLYDLFFDRSVRSDVDFSEHGLAAIDVVADAAALPFQDGSFDCVICTEVLEHCPDPLAVLREVGRVLRPGGSALVTTPFLLGLHELPHDYFRYTPPALRLLAERAELRCLSIEPRGDRVAVTLADLQYPLTKAVSKLHRLSGGRVLGYTSPVVQALVVLPQRLYLVIWRRTRRFRRATASPLGFITELERPA